MNLIFNTTIFLMIFGLLISIYFGIKIRYMQKKSSIEIKKNFTNILQQFEFKNKKISKEKNINTVDQCFEKNNENISKIKDKAIDLFKKNKKANDIYKLYGEGYDITDIAKKLNIGKGEVKLFIDLKKVGDIY